MTHSQLLYRDEKRAGDRRELRNKWLFFAAQVLKEVGQQLAALGF